jgi:hypothetical protein
MGLSYQSWLGNSPAINQVTVPLTYHLPLPAPFRPYLGGFYSRTMIDDNHEDYNSYGGRVGVTMMTSGRSYISAGWVQEVNEHGADSSSRGYPEISGGISF